MAHDALGSWMKERRKHLHLSQHDLAHRVGYAISTIRKVEIGLLRPSRAAAEALAACLEIPADDIPRFVRLARTPRDAPPPASQRSAGLPGAEAVPHPSVLPLFDREREVSFIRACLQHTPARLLSIVGPPGIGKTRLALHLATAVADLFTHPPCFLSLEALTDARHVVPTLARTLCQGATLTDIQAALDDRPRLLILDNFEHVLPAARDLAALLAACPQLTLIVTSRNVLNLSSEQQVPMVPLSYPPLHPLPQLRHLASYSAIQFFLACAQRWAPDYALTAETAPLIATICARLEGLPLAIEMVAARSTEFAPADLLARLDEVVGQLADPHLAALGVARQHTLRAAIDWSYRLLSADAQRLFRHLSVWSGGCTLEAIEQVCARVGMAGVDAAELLATVLDASLLQHHTSSPSGEPRFTMLAVLRAVARQELAATGDQAALHAAHARYYLALALEAQQHFRGPQEQHWIDRLQQEHENLRAALAWGAQHDPPLLVELSVALVRFWFLQGHFREGRDWLDAAGLQLGDDADRRQARVLHGMGVLAYAQSDCALAITHLTASLAILRQEADQGAILDTLNYLGNAASSQHQTATALRAYAEALEIAEAIGHQRMQATLLLNTGVVYYHEADFATAHRYFSACLAIHRQIQNAYGRAIALNNVGLIAYQRGDLPQARVLFAEAGAIIDDLANPAMRAEVLTNLARVALASAEPAQARPLLDEATTLRKAHGDRYAIAQLLEPWAALALAEGQPARALRLSAMSHALFLAVGASVTPLAHQERARIEARALPLVRAADQARSLAGIDPQLPLRAVFAYVEESAPLA